MLQLALIVLPISLQMEHNVFVKKDSIPMVLNVQPARPTVYHAQLMNAQNVTLHLLSTEAHASVPLVPM